MRILKKINKKFLFGGTLAAMLAQSFAMISCGSSSSKVLKTWGDIKFVRKYSNLSYADEVQTAQLINEIDYSVNRSNSMYQMLVYAFADGNGDGIGDFIGAKDKLSYLKNLGIDQIWLSPSHPASSYHGYDVIDYTDIAPEFGGMSAFNSFVEEAHKQNIKIYMDMVFNHTSYEHPWFQKALTNPESKYRDYYRFEDNKQYGDTTKLGLDTVKSFVNLKNPIESKTPYIGKFWGGMPDLNLDNPNVINELKNVQKFWIKKGIDGFRYDAFVEFYSSRGETKHNFDEKKIFSELRKSGEEGAKESHRNLKFDQFMMGEWWGDAQSGIKYFHNGAERALDSVYDNQNWRGQSIIKISDNYIKDVLQNYNSSDVNAQWTPFLDNHDQERWLTSYLKNIRHIRPEELGKPIDQQSINAMSSALFNLLILPGNPIIFQGDELAYHGIKGNHDAGLREPIKWNDGKYNINFYEKRSGKDTLININNSSDRPSAESQIVNNDQPANVVKRLNKWRKDNPFIGQTNINTIGDPSIYIKNEHGISNLLLRHSIDGTKKFLAISTYEGEFSFDLNANIENTTLQSKGVVINANKITIPKNSFVILELT